VISERAEIVKALEAGPLILRRLVRDRFEALRAELASLLTGAGDASWRRAGEHGEHGRITVQQLAAHTAGEDADHLAQIARMIPA